MGGNLENSETKSEIYVPNSEDNFDDDNLDDDNLDDDKNEIEDEDDDQLKEDGIEQTENGTDNETDNETDKCLYNLSKNNLDENNTDDEFIDDVIAEDEKTNILLEGDERITDPIMTKYEYVRIIGNRAKQIAMGSKKFVKNTDNLSSKEIAIL